MYTKYGATDAHGTRFSQANSNEGEKMNVKGFNLLLKNQYYQFSRKVQRDDAFELTEIHGFVTQERKRIAQPCSSDESLLIEPIYTYTPI